jgi:hypothetical protein
MNAVGLTQILTTGGKYRKETRRTGERNGRSQKLRTEYRESIDSPTGTASGPSLITIRIILDLTIWLGAKRR